MLLMSLRDFFARIPVLAVAAALLLATAGAAHSQQALPVAEGQGVIQALDFEKYTVLVSGSQFDVSQTVHVEIAGSYGAFTMLKTGMKVRFNFLLHPGGRREITRMYEDNFIEES